MGAYIVRRLLIMIPVLIAISILAFIVMELPAGDFVDYYISSIEMSGAQAETTNEYIDALKERYGYDRPIAVRYFKWFSSFITGKWGMSLSYNVSVKELLGERIMLTILITIITTIVCWIIAFPVGVYSAIKQYSPGDYFFTFITFFGLGVPSFLIALFLLIVNSRYFGASVGGLISREFMGESFTIAKAVDFLKHVWVPVVVLALGGTAHTIRIIRANLLDELKKPYVRLARAKGLNETRLIIKYPLRIAVNPVISSLAQLFPELISGSVIVAVVLNLDTSGPLFLRALRLQDMYLAGAFVMLIAIATMFGTLVSDILLAIVDPRIRYK